VFVEESNKQSVMAKSEKISDNDVINEKNENLIQERNKLQHENENLFLQIKKLELEMNIAKLKKSGNFSSPEKRENASIISSQRIYSPNTEKNAEKTIEYVKLFSSISTQIKILF
jgi:hypothetical protein